MHEAYSRRNMKWKLDSLFCFFLVNKLLKSGICWTFEGRWLTWLNFLYFSLLPLRLVFELSHHLPLILKIFYWLILRFLLTYYQKKHLSGNYRCSSQLLLTPNHAFMLSKLRLWFFAGSFSLPLCILWLWKHGIISVSLIWLKKYFINFSNPTGGELYHTVRLQCRKSVKGTISIYKPDPDQLLWVNLENKWKIKA